MVALAPALSGARAEEASVEHGKYLVEHVARCPECHTPRTESGELDRSRWMKGATLMALPIISPRDAYRKSPDLSSTSPLWSRWGEDGVERFLQTARNPRGNHADPPMPTYTLNAEDAQAIVAYLRTLP
ncbi:MAG: hypothetical protein JSU08_13215 [Acidobacteria bacterium]|nr:hypothetical protein [Acidobacteriota bacterium]